MLRQCNVILDFDGVITRLEVDWRRVAEEVSRRTGLIFESMLNLLPRIWNTELYRDVDEIIETFELEDVREKTVDSEVVECLSRLSKFFALHIATMQSRRVVEYFLRKHDLMKYFKYVLTRSEYPRKVYQVRRIIELANARPEQVYLIDDLERSCDECVEELGINCLILSSSVTSSRYPTFRRLRDVVDYLLRVEGLTRP